MDKRVKEFFIEIFNVGKRLLAVFLCIAIVSGVCSGIAFAVGAGKKGKNKPSSSSPSDSLISSDSESLGNSESSSYFSQEDSSYSSALDDDDSYADDTSFSSHDFNDGEQPLPTGYADTEQAVLGFFENVVKEKDDNAFLSGYTIKSVLPTETARAYFGTDYCVLYELSYTSSGQEKSVDAYIFGQEGDYGYEKRVLEEGDQITKIYWAELFSTNNYNNFKLVYTLTSDIYPKEGLENDGYDEVVMNVYFGDDCIYDDYLEIYYLFDQDGLLCAEYKYITEPAQELDETEPEQESGHYVNIFPEGVNYPKEKLVTVILNAYFLGGAIFVNKLDELRCMLTNSFFVMGNNGEIVFNPSAFANSSFDLSEDEGEVRQRVLEYLLDGGEDYGYYTVLENYGVEVDYEYSDGVVTLFSVRIEVDMYNYYYTFENGQINVTGKELMRKAISTARTELSMFGEIEITLPFET